MKNLLLLTIFFAIAAFLAVAGNAQTATGTQQNLALDGTVQITASSVYPSGNYSPSSAADGDRTGYDWGNGGGWNDGTRDVFPDTLTFTHARAFSFGRFVVTTLQDNFSSPVEPTALQTCQLYGIRGFRVEVLNLSGVWVQVAIFTNNVLCKRDITITPVRGTAWRIIVDSSWDTHYSRIVEGEAYASAPVN